MDGSESGADWETLVPDVPECPALPFSEKSLDWASLWVRPEIHETAWIAPGATVLGRVSIGAGSSIWFGCILRGDSDALYVGDETNVQDGSILHADAGWPVRLGNRVSLGHRATVHASVVEDGALIAMGATVLSRCVIGEGALVAAGAVVLEGTKIPPHTVWAGCPAKQLKTLNQANRDRLAHTYQHYVNEAAAYLARFGREHIDALMSPRTNGLGESAK